MAQRTAVLRCPDDTRRDIPLKAGVRTIHDAMEVIVGVTIPVTNTIVFKTRRIGGITLSDAIFGPLFPEVRIESLAEIRDEPVTDHLNRWMEIFVGNDVPTGYSITIN